ncbi:involucrin-like [Xiphophorus hellerii]|uniref:involucrin-like n=1 Tax=Xiphophorus hellerii TaxID=8084 RepID=UPI0013B3ADBB|nr:involucrin-like [Xiphophorus hellerii]
MFAVMMSSVQLKRDEQLTAAEETSTEFKGMAVKEEETEDQRRLLGFPRTPRFTSHRKDDLQDYVWKEEVSSDQQLWKQERDSSLDQEEPEPLQMTEEQQEPEHPWTKEEVLEICIGEHEDQLELKQEAEDTFMVTSNDEEKNHIKPEPIRNQVISQDFSEAENQDQEGNYHIDSESKQDKAQKPEKSCLKTIKNDILYSVAFG